MKYQSVTRQSPTVESRDGAGMSDLVATRLASLPSTEDSQRFVLRTSATTTEECLDASEGVR